MGHLPGRAFQIINWRTEYRFWYYTNHDRAMLEVLQEKQKRQLQLWITDWQKISKIKNGKTWSNIYTHMSLPRLFSEDRQTIYYWPLCWQIWQEQLFLVEFQIYDLHNIQALRNEKVKRSHNVY